jgi:hypothetical protein
MPRIPYKQIESSKLAANSNFPSEAARAHARHGVPDTWPLRNAQASALARCPERHALAQVAYADAANCKIKVTYRGEVLECGESHHAPLAIYNGNCQVCRFNQLEYVREGVNAVVDIILADLYQVNDLIVVVGISSTQHNALIVKLLMLFRHLVRSVNHPVLLLQNLLFFRLQKPSN